MWPRLDRLVNDSSNRFAFEVDDEVVVMTRGAAGWVVERRLEPRTVLSGPGRMYDVKLAGGVVVAGLDLGPPGARGSGAIATFPNCRRRRRRGPTGRVLCRDPRWCIDSGGVERLGSFSEPRRVPFGERASELLAWPCY